jgi:hypothetical protein
MTLAVVFHGPYSQFKQYVFLQRAARVFGRSRISPRAHEGAEATMILVFGRELARRGWLLLAGLASVLPIEAQQPSQPPAPICADCTLEFESLLTMDSRPDDHGLIPFVQGLAVDARGRVWMTVGPEGPVHVFSSDGRLSTTLGRRGQGPGEFTAPMAVVAFTDSVAVFDAGSGLASIYDMELQFVRSVRVPGQILRGVEGEGSLVIVNGIVPTPSSAGYPFHAVDLTTGEVLRSFGGDPSGAFSPRDVPLLVAFLDRDPDSGVIWTALRHRPLLQKWTRTGEPLATIELALPWFPEGGRASIRSPSTPPDPAVSGLMHDGQYLWVSFQVARAEWRRAWPTQSEPVSGHPRPEELPVREALFRGRMLLLDGAGGRVLRTWDTDLLPSLSATTAGALTRMHDPQGFHPALEILRPVLGTNPDR